MRGARRPLSAGRVQRGMRHLTRRLTWPSTEAVAGELRWALPLAALAALHVVLYAPLPRGEVESNPFHNGLKRTLWSYAAWP